MLRITALLITFASLSLAPGARAEGNGIRRCTSPDGSILYTDRDCASFGATDRLPPPSSRANRVAGGVVTAKGAQGSGTRPDCAASPAALVRSLGSAWQSRDVNRVAGLVDWQGAGTGTARRVLGRIGSALKTPPMDVVLEAPPVYAFEPDPYGGPATISERPGAEPTNVRVDRFGEDGIAGESVRFGLKRDMGCYWLDIASLD
jgi:hypothetical protein